MITQPELPLAGAQPELRDYVAYAEACWAYKRRLTHDEPLAPSHLDRRLCEAIARQCHIEFERGVMRRVMGSLRK
jgi:hypothetical protein